MAPSTIAWTSEAEQRPPACWPLQEPGRGGWCGIVPVPPSRGGYRVGGTGCSAWSRRGWCRPWAWRSGSRGGLVHPPARGADAHW